MYALAHKMLDDFDEDMNNNKHIDSSRMYMFTNLMDEVLKKKKQSYTKEEFLRIIRQVVDMEKEMDLDFQNMMKKIVLSKFSKPF